MTFDVIAPGSSGNAVVINKKIMIDGGVPFSRIRPHMKDLQLVLLTHIHGDHFNPRTVRALHRERPALRWGCCKWMVGPLLEAGVEKRQIDVFETGDTLCYFRLCFVTPEPLVHDVPNCGWRINTAENEQIFYATDTGTLDGIEAPDYDLYMIEANHTRADLEKRAREKMDAGLFSYELRAAKNHLSQEQAEEWLQHQMGPRSQYVFLHQHFPLVSGG